MLNPNLLPDRRRRNNRNRQNQERQNRTLGEQARDFISEQNPFFLFSMALALLGLLIQVMPYVLGGTYTILASVAVVVWTTFDFAFGARLVGSVPALMWTAWGAVLGACAAFWLSAPLYGWRNKRALIFLVPVLLMMVSGFIISMKTPLPAQPQLLNRPVPNVPVAPGAGGTAMTVPAPANQ